VALLSAGKLAAGRIPLHVACTQAACDGRAELILTVELRMRNKGRVVTRREALVLGSASYRLASGHSAVVEVPLSRQGLTALHDARHHKLTVSLRVSVAGGTTLVHRLVLIG
jgi:hypothetical protein